MFRKWKTEVLPVAINLLASKQDRRSAGSDEERCPGIAAILDPARKALNRIANRGEFGRGRNGQDFGNLDWNFHAVVPVVGEAQPAMREEACVERAFAENLDLGKPKIAFRARAAVGETRRFAFQPEKNVISLSQENTRDAVEPVEAACTVEEPVDVCARQAVKGAAVDTGPVADRTQYHFSDPCSRCPQPLLQFAAQGLDQWLRRGRPGH
nr:hypothetical protein [Stappia indica]